jgi:hypothetical protein
MPSSESEFEEPSRADLTSFKLLVWDAQTLQMLMKRDFCTLVVPAEQWETPLFFYELGDLVRMHVTDQMGPNGVEEGARVEEVCLSEVFSIRRCFLGDVTSEEWNHTFFLPGAIEAKHYFKKFHGLKLHRHSPMHVYMLRRLKSPFDLKSLNAMVEDLPLLPMPLQEEPAKKPAPRRKLRKPASE